ncbi:Adenosylcobinamide-GDP ribazoletransferase [Methanimicrococcus sp. At1]|uniref:Adenosylcobinamide-GDP ribazoletransferase n=1 Tax=Methanimicrococcus hacksteinii TaxID=3028293 RepID=A0ABU3VN00_9EURY|nr:adenosylcobinamide-GDP ribazoletransferase [Methanimicrococcus sp. At1]MDV0444773.1 Adenosylcobinamide-GDP ribazoletransferase [Methanimicrococcus sp. At1]
MTIWEAFKAGFGFLSVIPVGITMEGIDALMKRLYMYPIVGFCLGILIGIITFIAEIVLPSPLTIIAVMAAVYGIIWFNHLDGVADLGDGMTAHGSLEKKRKALKDMSLGIGGVAFAVLLMLFFYSSLYALESIVPEIIGAPTVFAGLWTYVCSAVYASDLSGAWGSAIITASMMALTATLAETCGKQSMLTIAAFGKSFSEGLGSMTIAGGTRKNFTIGIVFTAVVSFVLLGFIGLIALAASTLAAFIILRISNRHFEGLNGDGIGTSNEVGRAVTIASVAVFLFLLYGGMFWTL